MTILKKILLLLLLFMAASCEHFLDEKPNKRLIIPETLPALQVLLDNFSVINNNDPGAGEISADDYYLTDTDWASLSQEGHRRLYTWEKDQLFAPQSNEWSSVYRNVYYANTVLEGVAGIPKTAANTAQWNSVKGQALFTRAKAFLQTAVNWSVAYDPATAAAALGIPLRLSTDFNAVSTRASLQHTYDRITTDLKEAIALLPDREVHVMRPSRPAAYALLARTYLAMGRYELVEAYADSSLRLHSALLNFNELSPNATFPIPQFNQEVIYRSIIPLPQPLDNRRAKINPDLYSSYAADDLRKTVFFRDNRNGTYGFKGSYEGAGNLFSGVATNEVLLMRAEARARQGKVMEALEDLNNLLETRWKAGMFAPVTADTQPEAVAIILEERRKELLMRGLRWMDIKRLNREGAGINLTRSLDGQTFSLPANDPRFALPLPEDVIELSGMQQNLR